MKNQIHLITDIDHLSNGGFNKLNNLSNEPMSYILGEDHLPHVDTPVDGSDAGSDPVNHTKPIEITKKIDRVYDFSLSTLLLHAFVNTDSGRLAKWLSISSQNAATVLDTHDGVCIFNAGDDDNDGKSALLTPDEMDFLIETIHKRSGVQSEKAIGTAADNRYFYRLNCTYLDTLGGSDTEYLIARAIQFFTPGIPYLYYPGLQEETKTGKDINLSIYINDEAQKAKQPLTQKLINLIHLRNNHPAFNGEFYIEAPEDNLLEMRWEENDDWIMLHVDLAYVVAVITGSWLEEEIRYLD